MSYLEGGEVDGLEMLQGLTEGDQLCRLVCLASCGKREEAETPGFVTVVSVSSHSLRRSSCHL